MHTKLARTYKIYRYQIDPKQLYIGHKYIKSGMIYTQLIPQAIILGRISPWIFFVSRRTWFHTLTYILDGKDGGLLPLSKKTLGNSTRIGRIPPLRKDSHTGGIIGFIN